MFGLAFSSFRNQYTKKLRLGMPLPAFKRSPGATLFQQAGLLLLLAFRAFGATPGTVHGYGDYILGGKPAPLQDVVALRASARYTMALRADKTIALWGANDNGQLDVPAGISNVVAIAAGHYTPMALTEEGKIYVWGANGHVEQRKMLAVPPSATNVIAISGGAAHCLALRKDGRVVGWGNNLFGEADVPASVTNAVAIEAGQNYSLAITSEGKVVGWGNAVTAIPSNLKAIALSAGKFGHVLAIRPDGTVAAWGNNGSGQTRVPTGLRNVVAVSAGEVHSMALQADGTVVTWGNNDYGQGKTPPQFVKAAAIAAASRHSAVLSQAPLIESFSFSNAYPQAGDDVIIGSVVSCPLAWIGYLLKNGSTASTFDGSIRLGNVQEEVGGAYSLVASNEFGMSRAGPVSLQVAPSAPRFIEPLQHQAAAPGQAAAFGAVARGSNPMAYQWEKGGVALPNQTEPTLKFASVSLADEGEYRVTVSNPYGSIRSAPVFLAAGFAKFVRQPSHLTARPNWAVSFEASAISPTPARFQWFKDGSPVEGANEAKLSFNRLTESDAGVYFLRVTNDFGGVDSERAELRFAGEDRPRQGGLVTQWGSLQELLAPPTDLTNVTQIATGMFHILALSGDGSLRTWGDPGDLGLMTIPAEATNVVSIVAGWYHNLALRRDGTVVGWGNENEWPGAWRIPPNTDDIVAASGGWSHSLLLRADGTIRMVPPDLYVPGNATNIVAVAAGKESNFALTANGTVLTWVFAAAERKNLPPSHEIPMLGNVVQIAAGEWSNAALRRDGTVFAGAAATGGDAFPPAWEPVPGATNALKVAAVRGIAALLPEGRVKSLAEYPEASPDLVATDFSAGLTYLAAITPGPLFDSQPAGFVTFVGNTAGRLQANVRSATPARFQWFHDGEPVAGATNSFLEFGAATLGQSGRYYLTVSNANHQAKSGLAIVSVEGPPEILQVSGDRVLTPGETLELSATVIGNPSPLLQWRFNRVAIPHATNSSISRTNISGKAGGIYSLVASNSRGTAIGREIRVSVEEGKPVIVRQPSAPAALPEGGSLRLEVRARGTEPFAYEWFLDNKALPGEKSHALETSDFRLAASGDYFVVVKNRVGEERSATVHIDAFPSAPHPELNHPIRVVRAGKTVRFEAFAHGSGQPGLQWRFNGVDLPGETNAWLDLGPAQAPSAGKYSVLAWNALGTNESGAAALKVLPNISAGLLRGWGALTGTPDNILAEAVAAGRHGLALLPDGTMRGWGENTYGQATPPAGLSNVVAIAAGSDYSLALLSSGRVVGWGRNTLGQADPPADLTDAVAISAGPTYAFALRSDGSIAAWGGPGRPVIPPGTKDLAAIDVGNELSLAAKADGGVLAWISTPTRNSSLTNAPSALANIVAVEAGFGAGYALDAAGKIVSWGAAPTKPADATNITAIAAGFTHVLGLRADRKLFAWGSDAKGQVRGANGTSNILAIAAGEAASLAISGEPKLLGSLAGRDVAEGSRLQLSIPAIGAGPLSNQWYFQGKPLKGGTNADLVVESFSAADVGVYFLEVRNPFAAVKSASAVFTLGAPPKVFAAPRDLTVQAGAKATFSVQAEGSLPLLYQWMLNGTNLSGATNSSFSVSGVIREDQGRYSAWVSNAFGSALSPEAALLVTGAAPRGVELVLAASGPKIPLLRIQVEPGQAYRVDTSTDLANWTVSGVFIPSTPHFEFPVELSGNARRFYRLILLDSHHAPSP